MESRFRVRFWPSRRIKTEPNTELDLHSIPYQTAPANDKQPVFIHQSLGRNLSERRKSDTTSPLRAFSYRQTKAGKTPVFGGRPQKGNGPVKLQTNRILSTGELLETSQDVERTLEDIRDGEYIVAGRDGRESRSRSVKSPVPTSPSSQAPPHTFLSPNSQAPSLQPTWTTITASSPLLDIPENAIIYDASSPMTTQSEPVMPSFSRPHSRKQATVSPKASTEGLGISEAPPLPVGILKNSSKLSLLEPHEEQNPTIRALWKAEYGRLVAIYGQDGVDRNIMDVRRDSNIPRSDRRSREDGLPPFALDPLPRPSVEYRDGSHTARSSRTSRNEPNHQDDNSDESSKRLSYMSSAAYSSYTSGTSVAESESIVSRAEIRKMVDDMRSTYLQAIETREPSLQAVKSMKKRKKKRKSSTPGGTPRSSSVVRSSLGPSTPEPPSARQSMAKEGSSPTLQSQCVTRIVSEPVAGINKLPAIEASPSRDKEPEVGIKRADSSTLGTLMGETKRASIKRRKSKRNSRRLSTQSKSPEISPTKAAANLEPALDADIANMYSDIFRTSTHDFWQSSPTIASSVQIPSSFETTSTVFGTSPSSLPTKKSAFLV